MKYYLIFASSFLVLLKFSEGSKEESCENKPPVFLINHNLLDWESAKNSCISKGGNLATTGIRNETLRNKLISGQILPLSTSSGYWIGVHYSFDIFNWMYVDGVAVTDDNSFFQGGGPDFAGPCGLIYYSNNKYVMVNDQCWYHCMSICEIPCENYDLREAMCNKDDYTIGPNSDKEEGIEVTIIFPERFCQVPNMELSAFGDPQYNDNFEVEMLSVGFCEFRARVRRTDHDKTWGDPNVVLQWQVTFDDAENTIVHASSGICDPTMEECKSCANQITCFDKQECLSVDNGCPETQLWNGKSCVCETGYFKCTDAGECAAGEDIHCTDNATCILSGGNPTCACRDGFSGDGIQCTDKDECLTKEHQCHEDATCTNTHGSYQCTCKNRFYGDGLKCEDICVPKYQHIGSNRHDDNGVQVTVEFQLQFCQVPDLNLWAYGNPIYNDNFEVELLSVGFCEFRVRVHRTDHDPTWWDEDVVMEWQVDFGNATAPVISGNCDLTTGECKSCKKTTACFDGRWCTGSDFICPDIQTRWNGTSCVCEPGYFNCSGSGECIIGKKSKCHDNGLCVVTENSYTCTCGSGFTGDGITSCTDIDECLLKPSVCPVSATCLNKPGDYSCNCEPGFTGNHCLELACPDCFIKTGATCIFNREYIQQNTASGHCIDEIMKISRNVDTSVVASELKALVFSMTSQASHMTTKIIESLTQISNNTQANKLELLPQTVTDLLDAVGHLVENSWSVDDSSDVTVQLDKRSLMKSIGVSLSNVNLTQANGSFAYHSPTFAALIEQVSQNDHRENFVFSPTNKATPKINLPRSALLQGQGRVKRSSDDVTRLIFTYHKHPTLYTSKQTVSPVIGVSVSNSNPMSEVDNPVVIQYGDEVNTEMIQSALNARSLMVEKQIYECAYYNNNEFVTEGCCLVPHTELTKCECNHFADYALLIKTVKHPADVVLGTSVLFSCILSIVGAALTVILLVIHRKSLGRPAKILTQICVNLLISYLIFVVGIARTEVWGACTLVAALLHYFMLVTCFWMAAYSYDLYINVVKVDDDAVRGFLKRAIFAYLTPAFIVVPNMAIAVFYIDLAQQNRYCGHVRDTLAPSSYRAVNMCWLTGNSLNFGFLLPVGILLLFNIVVLALVLSRIVRGKSVDSSVQCSYKQRLFMAAYLSTIVVLCWVFGYLMLVSTDMSNLTIMKWIFSLLNAIQGLSVFLLTIAFNPELRTITCPPLRRATGPGDPDQSTFTGANVGDVPLEELNNH